MPTLPPCSLYGATYRGSSDFDRACMPIRRNFACMHARGSRQLRLLCMLHPYVHARSTRDDLPDGRRPTGGGSELLAAGAGRLALASASRCQLREAKHGKSYCMLCFHCSVPLSAAALYIYNRQLLLASSIATTSSIHSASTAAL